MRKQRHKELWILVQGHIDGKWKSQDCFLELTKFKISLSVPILPPPSCFPLLMAAFPDAPWWHLTIVPFCTGKASVSLMTVLFPAPYFLSSDAPRDTSRQDLEDILFQNPYNTSVSMPLSRSYLLGNRKEWVVACISSFAV